MWNDIERLLTDLRLAAANCTLTEASPEALQALAVNLGIDLSLIPDPADPEAIIERIMDPAIGFNRKYHYIAENKILQVFIPYKKPDPTPVASAGRPFTI